MDGVPCKLAKGGDGGSFKCLYIHPTHEQLNALKENSWTNIRNIEWRPVKLNTQSSEW